MWATPRILASIGQQTECRDDWGQLAGGVQVDIDSMQLTAGDAHHIAAPIHDGSHPGGQVEEDRPGLVGDAWPAGDLHRSAGHHCYGEEHCCVGEIRLDRLVPALHRTGVDHPPARFRLLDADATSGEHGAGHVDVGSGGQTRSSVS